MMATSYLPESNADRRHGTVAGYNRIPCRDECCRAAYARWRRGRDYDTDHGRPRVIPSVGSQRRIQALTAIGWTMRAIADATGTTQRTVALVLERDTITAAKAARVTAAYDRLSMRLPPQDDHHQRRNSTRARNWARREGWPPPLAWDDDQLDTPSAQPYRNHGNSDRKPDYVVIHRALSGEPVKANPAERRIIIDRWRGGRNDLADLLGANIWRDLRYAS